MNQHGIPDRVLRDVRQNLRRGSTKRSSAYLARQRRTAAIWLFRPDFLRSKGSAEHFWNSLSPDRQAHVNLFLRDLYSQGEFLT